MVVGRVIDLNSTIVCGSDLRILLNSDHLSYGEVHLTLREKGVFVGNSDKSITVPLLSSTLLTPDNFTRLIETSVNRESQPKVKVAGLALAGNDVDWIAVLKKDLFDASFNPTGDDSGIVFTKNPSLVVCGSDRVQISYQICRQDISKDWIERELTFDGQVALEKIDDKLKIDFISTHSSKETDVINKKLTSRVSKILHNAGIATTDEAVPVSFGAFDNEERVRYFKRLTAGHGSCLPAGSVGDIEICLDPDGPALPDDLEVSWMKQTVRRLNVDGERLNDIFLLNDEKYYKHYYITRMNVAFPFIVATNSGQCHISFFFSGSRIIGEKSELTFACLRWYYNDAPNTDARKEINLTVQHALRSMIEEKFELTLSERMPAATLA